MSLFDVTEQYEGTVNIARYGKNNKIEYTLMPAIIMKGLAVTQAIESWGKGWVVTHVKSGYVLGNRTLPSQEEAILVMTELNTICDWYGNKEEIQADPITWNAGKAILIKYKLLEWY